MPGPTLRAGVRHLPGLSVIELDGEINITRLVEFMDVFNDEASALAAATAA